MLLLYGAVILTIILLSARLWQILLGRRQISESKNWPATNGVITKSWSEWAGRGKYAMPVGEFEYEYEVEGQTFRNSRINYTWRDARSDYERGQQVTVYYLPDDPQTSVLEPGGRIALVRCLPIVIFLAFFIFLLAWLLFVD